MKFIQNSKKFYLNVSVVLFIFFLDRISKIYVMHISQNNFGYELYSSKYLNIFPIWNRGISFGLLSFEEKNIYNLLSILILTIIIFLIVMTVKSNGLKRFCFLIIVGGAFGNLYDRIKFNGVIDFIDFHVGNFHWFIFNVSDIFITLGIIGMILMEIFSKNKREDEKN